LRPPIAAIIAAIVAMSAGQAHGRVEAPRIAASAAILIDAETGQVLYEKNADERRPIASTTKIMTALLILEHGNLDAPCTISQAAASTPQSSIWLEPGESVRLNDLLTAVLVKSANDAAAAAAEAVAGSQTAFVDMMNARARELGAQNTHFANPHGLYDPQHYSSARDLAAITQVAMRQPRFAELVSTRRATIPWPGKDCERLLLNKNKLLTMMPGADGVKTGYVKESGQCLVASASRDGWRLIAVLLDSPELWAEAQTLLDYGFGNFRALQFAHRGRPVVWVNVLGGEKPRVSLVPSRSLMLVLPKTTRQSPVYMPRIDLTHSRFSAPVRAGQPMGRMVLVAGNRELRAVDLLAAEAVPRSLLASFWVGMSRFMLCLVAAAIVVRGYSVATKRGRTRRLYVRLTSAPREPRSGALPQ
jgi:D-alanyl-D-alanine carboxypeptidase (penicillin-binding protein 5/6)